MPTRDEKFTALIARAEKARDDEADARKRRRQWAGQLRAWSATGALTAAERKQVQNLTRGLGPKRKKSADDS
jgi:hypothetical protein